MKEEDWQNVIKKGFDFERRASQIQRSYERKLIEAYIQTQGISDYSIAERKLRNEGKIFGELEVKIEDVVHGKERRRGSIDFAPRPLPRPEMEMYERISRRATQEFKQRTLKPMKIIFPNVYPDMSYAGAYVGSRWHDENGLYPHITDVINEFNANNELFEITGGSVTFLNFGYKIPENK